MQRKLPIRLANCSQKGIFGKITNGTACYEQEYLAGN